MGAVPLDRYGMCSMGRRAQTMTSGARSFCRPALQTKSLENAATVASRWLVICSRRHECSPADTKCVNEEQSKCNEGDIP